MKIISYEEDHCIPQNSISTKIAVFGSDRKLYIFLRGRCCIVFILNVHSPSKEKIII